MCSTNVWRGNAKFGALRKLLENAASSHSKQMGVKAVSDQQVIKGFQERWSTSQNFLLLSQPFWLLQQFS
jgi:hypothetical protein